MRTPGNSGIPPASSRRSAAVLVAGAGVVGASVAYHLARRGCRDVVVIDRGPEPGTGSTSKATGGFRAQFDSETNIRLSLLAREKLRAFEDETGVDSGYRPHGYLFLATSTEELERLRRAQELQHACGLAEARMVSPAEARELNPLIEDDTILGGTFCPTDGFIRPMNILRGYVEAAQRLGVRFEFGVEWPGDWRGEIVVNARGAWAGAPVIPLRRNAACTVVTDLAPESMPMTIWSPDWFHLRMRDGRMLMLWPDDPPDDDAWLPTVQRFARERVPRAAALAIDHWWSGLYEMSPDEHALLGRTGENEYAAIGNSGHGVMHAPALGQLLAEIILDGRASSMDVTALRPDRFQQDGESERS